MTPFEYSGTELEIFERAINWKAYWTHQISPHIGDSVLEVGAGIGANTKGLYARENQTWLCLEPDARQCAIIDEKIKSGILPPSLEAQAKTINDLDDGKFFDTILYIDVLEHIKEDGLELINASSRLLKGGKIVIISPAHNFLFSEFDTKIGHYRRYNRKMLQRIIPSNMKKNRLYYLDSIGFFASLANKLLLKSSDPTHKQIQLWDRLMVRASRVADPLLGYNFGKTIVCIIEKET
jgi:2-polyprenyl-3-methyl-5-hydroxy-6-metoxy-1,4-benzoquinol methylase